MPRFVPIPLTCFLTRVHPACSPCPGIHIRDQGVTSSQSLSSYEQYQVTGIVSVDNHSIDEASCYVTPRSYMQQPKRLNRLMTVYTWSMTSLNLVQHTCFSWSPTPRRNLFPRLFP
ncbi:hypothetical protein JB92DRAFT_2993962 [Gautieria morchelliformis]|nr:hypothetical protein JB92DRAFT_2993962 [Gautieria morchelliformis]